MFLKFHKTLFLPELAGSQIYFPAPVCKLFWKEKRNSSVNQNKHALSSINIQEKRTHKFSALSIRVNVFLKYHGFFCCCLFFRFSPALLSRGVTIGCNYRVQGINHVTVTTPNLLHQLRTVCIMAFWLVVFLSFLSITFGKSVPLRDLPPRWPTAYSVSGVLRLPYAEIVEPFQAWFDAQNGRSRIDYYGGKINRQF